MPKPYIFKKKDSKQVNVVILRQKLKNQINNNIEIVQFKKSDELVSSRFKKHQIKLASKSKKLGNLIVNLMFTRTYSNVFLSAVNYKGNIIVQQSTGLCNLHSKKKTFVRRFKIISSKFS